MEKILFVRNVIITMYHVLRKRIWCPSCTSTLMYRQTDIDIYIYICSQLLPERSNMMQQMRQLMFVYSYPSQNPAHAVKQDRDWVPTKYIDIDYFRNNLLTSTMRVRHFANSHLRCTFQIHQLKQKGKKEEKRIWCLLHIKISLFHGTAIIIEQIFN